MALGIAMWATGAEGRRTATSFARFVQVDGTNHLKSPVVERAYQVDTVAPSIGCLSVSPEVAYPGTTVHFALQAEPGGSAWVGVSTLTLQLFDDGTSGDPIAGDGVYELDYVAQPEDGMMEEPAAGIFADTAGNPAPLAYASRTLTIDATATKVSGTFFSDQLWTLENSPYIVTGDTVFDVMADLVIEPGVVIFFENSAQLTLRGAFEAFGTEAQPIVIHQGNLLLDGERNLMTNDEKDGSYVAGPLLDHVLMEDGIVSFGNDTWDAAGAYIVSSRIGTLTGATPGIEAMTGVYVDHSWIGNLTGLLQESRITNSYLARLNLMGGHATWAEFTFNHIGLFENWWWTPGWDLSFNELDEMRLSWPGAGDLQAVFHDNNIGSAESDSALTIVRGDSSHPVIDATGNYWGAATTAQMEALGALANITAIHDYFDDKTTNRVDYSGWLSSPVDAGPNWQPVSDEGAVCEADGGIGGSGGSGGSSGSGGAGGSGGMGASGGANGAGGTSSGGTGGTSGSGGTSGVGGSGGSGGSDGVGGTGGIGNSGGAGGSGGVGGAGGTIGVGGSSGVGGAGGSSNAGGSSSSGGGSGSSGRACDATAAQQYCMIFSGTLYTDATIAQSCTTGSVVSSCPSGAYGRCTLHPGGSQEVVAYYYEGNGYPANGSPCTSAGGIWQSL